MPIGSFGSSPTFSTKPVGSISYSGSVSAGTTLSVGQTITTGGAAAGAGSGITIGRTDSTAEGGQLGFARAVDNVQSWYIDSYGNTTTPSLRFIDTQAGVVRAAIDASGHLIPGATSTYDLGTASLRWRNLYTQDLNLSNGIGDYTVIEGEEDLFLVNNKTGKSFKFALIEVDPSVVPPRSKDL